MNENSLANLQPGSDSKGEDVKTVTARFSRQTRAAYAAISKVKSTTRTQELERVPYLWLALRECGKHVPENSTLGQQLKALNVVEVGEAIAHGHVLEDFDGDCTLCGSAGYDWAIGPNCDCLACEGRGDFDVIDGLIDPATGPD